MPLCQGCARPGSGNEAATTQQSCVYAVHCLYAMHCYSISCLCTSLHPGVDGIGAPDRRVSYDTHVYVAVQVMLPYYECLPEEQLEGLEHDCDYDCPKVRSFELGVLLPAPGSCRQRTELVHSCPAATKIRAAAIQQCHVRTACLPRRYASLGERMTASAGGMRA